MDEQLKALGVETFNLDEAKARRRRTTVSVTGRGKSGKTYMATHVQHPLWYVMMDSHDNLDAALTHAAENGFDGDVHILRIATIRYDELSQEEAKARVTKIETFAKLAKLAAITARAQGTPTGTFVLDGMVKFKGYLEKALLGESATLGYRPKAGVSTGISTYDYAEPNAALADFVSGFGNSALDLVITWEGRRKYIGKERTDTFLSKIPDNVAYAVNVEVECIMDLEAVVANSVVVAHRAVPKLRIGPNGYNHALTGMVVKSQTLDDLKKLFGLAELDKPVAEIIEAPGYVPNTIEGSSPFGEEATTDNP